ncbi:FAD synthetase family protein [Szabonella alba]|uniref:FAD synthase n=1 Tax=Szabonella alba TaxID=2804194 RepID=A0A8K0VBG5_9RHOB|nr:FAD synthetase family protein [Szabonella alba]MBL4919012.1 FAD synthetase family protein [Szabonella alba]
MATMPAPSARTAPSVSPAPSASPALSARAVMPAPGRGFGDPALVTRALPLTSALRGGVLLLGNFDGFHLGHLALVTAARRAAPGRPLGVLSCTPHPRAFFRPDAPAFQLATPRTQQKMLARAGVDFIFAPRFDAAFAALSPAAFVTDILRSGLGVSHVVAGRDFRFGLGRAGDSETLRHLGREAGIGTSIIADISGPDGRRISSTLIRACLAAGDLDGAQGLLGGDWLVETTACASGGLQLHPLLCRPAPGRYLARMAGKPCQMPQQIRLDGDGRIHAARATLRPGLMHLLPAS